MSEDSIYYLDLIIDDLTNSIPPIDTGESFDTDLFLATDEDIKLATKKNGWLFSWKAEFRQEDRVVYKLISSFARYNKIDDEHKAEAMKVAF